MIYNIVLEDEERLSRGDGAPAAEAAGLEVQLQDLLHAHKLMMMMMMMINNLKRYIYIYIYTCIHTQ